MTPDALSRNIAVSLTLGAWDAGRLQAVAERRLPPTLRRHASVIASDVMDALPGDYAPSVSAVAAALRASPAFGLLLRYCQRTGAWPEPDLSTPEFSPVPVFDTLDLPGISTPSDLADWLLIPPERLEYLADPASRHERHDEMAVNHYHYHLRRKRSGAVRLIEAPKSALKSMQRQILRGIVEHVPVHPSAFGFVKGRNCVQGAATHAGEAMVLRFDLGDFFPSVQGPRIHGMFRRLGYPHAVARLLTGFCVTATPPRVLDTMPISARDMYRVPHLPQGSPVSPGLANLLCFSLDRRLSGLASHHGATFTRYADDLTFSGDAKIAGPLLRLVPTIVREEGFRLNVAKTRVMTQGRRQCVTGVVVNQHVNIDRDTFDLLKAVIHACGRKEDARLDDPAFAASLLGKIDWVASINPKRGEKLRQKLARSIASRSG